MFFLCIFHDKWKHATDRAVCCMLYADIQTCQNLVCSQPCDSHALYLLGSSQFNKYENSSPGEAATKLLHEARTSFEASIELQGKPAEGELSEVVAGAFSTSVLPSHLRFQKDLRQIKNIH